MPKRKRLQPVAEEGEVLEVEDFLSDSRDDTRGDQADNAWQRTPLWLRFAGTTLGLIILLAGSFELVYAGKIFPGVSADGVYLGGLTKSEAVSRLNAKVQDIQGSVITITNGDSTLRIPVASLAVIYDTNRAAQAAFNFGRTGALRTQIHAQARALAGHTTDFSDFHYPDDHLTPYLVDLDDDVVSPVQDASLNFNDSHAQVTPAQSGARLDLGRLTELVNARLAAASDSPITAPVYHLAPQLDTAPLQAAVKQIDSYVSGPITLSYNGTDRDIDQQTIISWVQVAAKPVHQFLDSHDLNDLYPPPPAASLGLSPAAVKAYVANLAGGIDQTAQNAGLAMQDGQLQVVSPSRGGVKLDQADAVSQITAALTKTGDARHISLKLTTATPDVNENNLASLGIKELISEGETTFPGSTSARITNVRVGAARFNGVLLKPGETFSFGKILGDVGPAQGYVPELVILGNHEEKQYGGGLCQVATTAYRAALLAGLPINERHNHSFAVSYYTAPYGVPGVDATIYYPEVDLKFTNDTGSYILIQTVMQGTDLKFDFFGTKTKSGQIRGPQFVSGSSDAKQASHTVFWRDVLDLNGNVIKTDTINTYYQPSTDFPVLKQYN